MKPVNVLLAGIGGYGAAYLRPLLSARGEGRCRLIGVADPHPQNCPDLQELHDRRVNVFTDYHEMLRRSPEAELVCLSTPIHLHAPQTIAALRAGMDVLCEKPLAGGLADGRRMVEAAESRPDRFVAIGYQWSFTSTIRRLKEDILAGRLGRPLRFRTWVSFPRGFKYFARNTWAGRRYAPDGSEVNDSPLNNATSHYLHNLLYLLGDSPTTSALPRALQAELYQVNEVETFDTAALRCEVAGDVEILFYTTHVAPTRHLCGRLEFEHATIDYGWDQGDRRFVARFRDGRTVDYGDPDEEREEKIWQCVDAVRTRQPIACGPRAALAQTACVAAARASCDPALPIPARFVREVQTDGEGGFMRCVEEMGPLLANAFEAALLPSELERVPWTAPGRLVAVEDAPAPARSTPAKRGAPAVLPG